MTLQSDSPVDPLQVVRRPRQGYSAAADYDKLVVEQYSIAVEMADRLASRRLVANSMFVTIHSAAVAAIATLGEKGLLTPSRWLVAPFLALLALCVLWSGLLRAYRLLASAKFSVIHFIEAELPFAVFDAEWRQLHKLGRRGALFRQTNWERGLPIVFMVLYAGMALLAAF